MGPQVDMELTMADLQHQLFLMTVNNRLSLAPVSPHVRNVLDIGTGTGIWALDFGMDVCRSQ